MMSEEDIVIEGVGRAQGPRPVAANAEARPPATAEVSRVGPEVTNAAPQEAAVSNLARISKELAASPPVDAARVEALRLAIASGDYKPDPTRIAAAMIALETPPEA